MDIVRANEDMFSKTTEDLEQVFDDLNRMGPPENAWDTVAPSMENLLAEQEEEGRTEDREFQAEEENLDLGPAASRTNRSELHARFSTELDKSLMTLHDALPQSKANRVHEIP